MTAAAAPGRTSGTSDGLRVLGPADLDDLLALVARDPVTHVFADYRARLTRLDPRWLGGEFWGWYADGQLVSACHSAANLVPVAATPAALEAFAARALRRGRRCSTVVGPQAEVRGLWERLERAWSSPRDCRWEQPHLRIGGAPSVEPDPRVTRTREDQVDVLYPACVAMYTEEVGVSPEAGGGGDLYRTRVRQLVARGWSFSRIEHGRVVFKAEVAAASPHACQVQGVWVAPERRGEGLAAAGMAAVVEQARATVAPVVSLYVNAHNTPARRTYERVGFTPAGTFATIMF